MPLALWLGLVPPPRVQETTLAIPCLPLGEIGIPVLRPRSCPGLLVGRGASMVSGQGNSVGGGDHTELRCWLVTLAAVRPGMKSTVLPCPSTIPSRGNPRSRGQLGKSGQRAAQTGPAPEPRAPAAPSQAQIILFLVLSQTFRGPPAPPLPSGGHPSLQLPKAKARCSMKPQPCATCPSLGLGQPQPSPTLGGGCTGCWAGALAYLFKVREFPHETVCVLHIIY